MKILDIKLTYRCNNNCVYCCQDRRLRGMSSDLSVQEVREILQEEQAQDVAIDKIVLTGGELTLNKDLLDIISVIKASGITDIQLQTNARRLQDAMFCKLLIDEGINNFGISLHGSRSEIHNQFTGTSGSFQETIKALETLRTYKMTNVALNTVVTRFNMHDLGEIIKLVEEESYAKSLQFAFIHMTGEATKISQDLVKIKEVATCIKEAIVNYSSNKIGIFTEAIPFCLMRGHEKSISELRNMKAEVITRDKFRRIAFSTLQKSQFKAKGERCQSGCLFFGMCEGTWKEYPEMYGFDEFEPVKEI